MVDRLQRIEATTGLIFLLAFFASLAYPKLTPSGWIAIAAVTLPIIALVGLLPGRELLPMDTKKSAGKIYARRLMVGIFAALLIVYSITFLTFLFNGFWFFQPSYPPYVPHDSALDYFALLEGLAIFAFGFSLALYQASIPKEYD